MGDVVVSHSHNCGVTYSVPDNVLPDNNGFMWYPGMTITAAIEVYIYKWSNIRICKLYTVYYKLLSANYTVIM